MERCVNVIAESLTPSLPESGRKNPFGANRAHQWSLTTISARPNTIPKPRSVNTTREQSLAKCLGRGKADMTPVMSANGTFRTSHLH